MVTCSSTNAPLENLAAACCALMLMCGLTLSGAVAQAPRALPYVTPCEALCANLFSAIQKQPDDLVMRLEDALVINQACAGEIVRTAIEAVNGDPYWRRKIVETALEIAPRQSASIRQSAQDFAVPAARPAPQEEIMRAILPETGLPQVEIRRAQTPGDPRNSPLVEIRRAEIPSARKGEIKEEIRRAVIPAH